jgi:hypothetical protein
LLVADALTGREEVFIFCFDLLVDAVAVLGDCRVKITIVTRADKTMRREDMLNTATLHSFLAVRIN